MKGKTELFEPRLTVGLTDAGCNTLDGIAENDKVSVSWTARCAVEGFLDQRPSDRIDKTEKITSVAS